MSAKKKTTVLQTENVNPLESASPLIQTAAKVAQGEVPSTSQITSAMESAKQSIAESRQEAPLSLKGEILAKDTQEVIDSAEKLLAEKNRGEKLQNLIQSSQQLGTEANVATQKTGVVFNVGGMFSPAGTMASEAQQVVNYLRDLGYYTIQSSDFRGILIDLIDFMQDMLAKSSENLNRLGEAAKSDIRRDDTSLTSTSEVGKDIAREGTEELRQQVDSTIGNRQWTEEQKRKFYDRFSDILRRLSSRPEYRRATSHFFNFIKMMKQRAEEIRSSTEKLGQTSAFDKTINDAKELIGEFTGKENIDSWWQQSWDFYYKISSDDEANRYFDDLRDYINGIIENPDSLNSDAKRDEGNRLLERGRNLINSDKYSVDFNRWMDSGRHLLDRIKNDSTTNEFIGKVQKLFSDFALDSKGRPDLFTLQDSLNQLRLILLPVLSKQLSSLPIPRVEGSNENYDFALENVRIYVSDFIPEMVQLTTKSDTKLDVAKLETSKQEFKVILSIERFRPRFEDVVFWYKRKHFPKLEDRGIVDIDLSAGEGTRIKIVWKIKSEANKPFTFSLMKVKSVIDKMDIKIKDAKHDVLDKIATTMFIGTIKQQVAQAIVNNLVDSLQPINDQMNKWFASHPIDTLMENANRQLKSAYEKGVSSIPERPLETALETGKQIYENVKQGISLQTETAKENIQQTVETAKETLGVEKEGKQEETPYFAPQKWNYQWKGREGLEERKEGLGLSEQRQEGLERRELGTESLGQESRQTEVKTTGLLTGPKEPLVSK
jgi:hypothetical protein